MTDRRPRLEALLGEQPGDAFLLFALAQEHRKHGDLDRAAATFAELRERHPDYVGLYYHLAAVHTERGQTHLAEEVYRAGIDVAVAAGDQHALAELRNAYVNWQLGAEDDA